MTQETQHYTKQQGYRPPVGMSDESRKYLVPTVRQLVGNLLRRHSFTGYRYAFYRNLLKETNGLRGPQDMGAILDTVFERTVRGHEFAREDLEDIHDAFRILLEMDAPAMPMDDMDDSEDEAVMVDEEE